MSASPDWVRRHLRLTAFAVLVALQVIVVLGFTVREETFLRTGAEILVQSRPVDPRDPLRGDFIILAYDFERVTESEAPGAIWCCRGRQNAYVWMRLVGDYHEPYRVTSVLPSRADRPEGTVVLRGNVEQSSDRELSLSFTNINQVFVPQGQGNPPEPPDVRLAVSRDGSARIKGLLIDGRAWP
jgi:uncharacterized membrane-anchored protein